MAARMDHHRRKKACDVRPAYRDGRSEKAVKVYTINQESCYLIIQGVPDIKVTEELLKLFSLYGTIEEYRILEDFPAEAFTKVYWVKYVELQAARVAKRKMDDRPFYGGTLHISYAPEYESVEDTGRKLQERRKEVARRLKKLQQESHAEVPSTSHGKPASTMQDSNDPLALKSSTQTSTGQDSNTSQLIGPRKPDSLPNTSTDSHQSVNESSVTSPGDHSEKIPEQLPAPPRTLPVWEWEDPVTSRDQYPRLPTAHATLPRNFNPYPDGYQPNIPGNQHKNNLTPMSNTVTNTEGEPVTTTGASDLGQIGGRPRFKLGRDSRRGDNAKEEKNQRPRLRFLERVAWRDRSETPSQDGTSANNRTRPVSLKGPHPDQCSNPPAQTSGPVPPNLQTSSFVPRQLLGKRKHTTESSQPEQAGFGLSYEGGAGHSEQRGHGDTGLTEAETPPVTGDASFDRTVKNIRRQMRNVVPARSQVASVQQQVAPAPQPAAAPAGGPSATKRPRI
ncbi:uncharacterized protein LOC119721369 [Patiria miniata]|uniref:RNA-binding protein 48 n=1 Tax=Patiria miniata TaxID=46514 RepID=A0A913Z6M5_PATMI|nr:uncharacterized protein LOC119721369 [Patiria miniata]